MIDVAGRARRTDQDSIVAVCVCVCVWKCDGQFEKTRLVLVIVCNVFITVGAKLVGTGDIGNTDDDVGVAIGASVSLSTDGNTLATGGPRDDMVRRTIAL